MEVDLSYAIDRVGKIVKCQLAIGCEKVIGCAIYVAFDMPLLSQS